MGGGHGGEMLSIAISTWRLWCWLTIGDVREGSDEEHITYSGGSKIKDLAQCG